MQLINWRKHLHKTTNNVLVDYLKGTVCIAYRSYYEGVFFNLEEIVFGSEGPKKFFWETRLPIYLRVWTTGPLPLISGSGSDTATSLFKTVTGCKKMVV